MHRTLPKQLQVSRSFLQQLQLQHILGVYIPFKRTINCYMKCYINAQYVQFKSNIVDDALEKIIYSNYLRKLYVDYCET